MEYNFKIAKLDETVTMDSTLLPESSIQYVMNYGLTQSVNDAAASVIRKNFATDEAFRDAVRVKCNKRIAQIESGDVPGTRVVDPNAAQARRIAKAMKENPELAAKFEELLAA